MTPFLKELAEKIVSTYGRLDELTFVFPNRRAALYFEYYLASLMKKPQWSPTLLSIEDFFKRQTDTKEPDKLTLIHKLYGVYSTVLKSNEPFDRFYFWGDMLLRDFDEIDKYLVNAQQLFKDLSRLKELDETFDYLTAEQKKFLQDFWNHFEDKPSKTKEEFLLLWRKLPRIYAEYIKALRQEGIGYEGMIHREVAEKFQKKPPALVDEKRGLIFAGFNAFTKSEEVVVTCLVEQGAQIFWDSDSYYAADRIQEAGMFMREYRLHPILGKTFPETSPSLLLAEKKVVNMTGVPQRIGQAKLAGRQVGEILKTLPRENLPMELSRTVIVLPDESMLLPVMHSLPSELDDINVTMGFPLKDTPLFNLLDLIIEMQVKRKGKNVFYREATGILAHPYLAAQADEAMDKLQQEIVERNRIYVPLLELNGKAEIYGLIFKDVDAADATPYLLAVIQALGAGFTDKRSFDREYSFHFYQHISRLDGILGESGKSMDWRGFQKLFRQVILAQKIPFSGEPLRGLQIMGVLETRNLDFDNVIILSLNEGMLPALMRQGSYVPHAIRKAYGLPTYEHQDAIYAYLFYRMLQRAKNIHFYFNTEPDILGNGEMSRYLQQLLLESGLEVEKFVLHNPVHVQQAPAIEIRKSKEILPALDRYVVSGTDAPSMLSPSVLNDYIECTLRFYLKHIARLQEADEVEEEPDARIFGNILHEIMHGFYEEVRTRRAGMVTPGDFANTGPVIDRLMDAAFRKIFETNKGEPVVYEGRRVVVREIAKTFVAKILERDAEYAPFEIRMLEEPYNIFVELEKGRKVKLGGRIDRADRKMEAGQDAIVRVIDYKTGKVEFIFDSVESLFTRDTKRNKSAFQTMLYAFVYAKKYGSEDRIVPGLINHKNLFSERFSFGLDMGKGQSRTRLKDVRQLLPEFEKYLRQVLEELYDPAIAFRQTTYEENCTYCIYKSLCRK